MEMARFDEVRLLPSSFSVLVTIIVFSTPEETLFMMFVRSTLNSSETLLSGSLCVIRYGESSRASC